MDRDLDSFIAAAPAPCREILAGAYLKGNLPILLDLDGKLAAAEEHMTRQRRRATKRDQLRLDGARKRVIKWESRVLDALRAQLGDERARATCEYIEHRGSPRVGLELTEVGTNKPQDRMDRAMPGTSVINVFISHAHEDAALADAVVGFLEGALVVPEGGVRCTSRDGDDLVVGASTSSLRAELLGCTCFIALITPVSITKHWVLFELGARWGAEKQVAPILHPACSFDLLPDPLRATVAAKADDARKMIRLVESISKALGWEQRAHGKVEAAGQKLASFAKALPSPRRGAPPAKPAKDVTEVVRMHLGEYLGSAGVGASEGAHRIAKLGEFAGWVPVVIDQSRAVVRDMINAQLEDETVDAKIAALARLVLELDHLHGDVFRKPLEAALIELCRRAIARDAIATPEYERQAQLLLTMTKAAYGGKALEKLVATLEKRAPDAVGYRSHVSRVVSDLG